MHPVSIPVTDFHTHAFPDTIVDHAMEHLSEVDGMNAYHDGTLAGLQNSMARCGIGRAVLCTIATKPDHFENIFAWCCEVCSDSIVPLPSVHPADPFFQEHLELIAEQGFVGTKIHPYYQDFTLDDPAYRSFFAVLERLGLLVVSHTGFDAAFPDWQRIADPRRILRLLERHPDLRLITTHLGAWEDWDEVVRHLIGKDIWIEISFAFGRIPDARIKRLLEAHPEEYLLFGTDSPWTDQGKALESLRALGLEQKLEEAILCTNAQRLLSEKGSAI